LKEEKQPISGGWQGRDVLLVLEAVDRSIRHKGAHVRVAQQKVARSAHVLRRVKEDVANRACFDTAA